MQAYLLRISGRVQGVGFRWFTAMEARARGIKGYVRNLADGRVEVFAQGNPEALEEFLARVRRGPGAARVEDVLVQQVEPDPSMDSFEVTF